MSVLLLLFSSSLRKALGITIIPPDDDDIIIEQNTISLTLPVPGGITNKDALVALISTDGDPALTPPAGWTLEASIGNTAKAFLYYRISSGSEPATYTWTLDGAEDAVGAILRLRNVNTDNLINAKVTDSGTGSIITVPSITTTVDKTMLITLLSLNDGALIDESELKKSQRKGLWVVNTSGEVIGSVGSSANYKTIKKAGTEPAYNLPTIGDISTDFYSVQVAFNPRGSNPPAPPPSTDLYDAYVYLYDLKASGVQGGTATAGSWFTRDITTEVEDTANICTLAANQFTLDAGTYKALISVPAHKTNDMQARLYNITDAAMELLGTSEWIVNTGIGGTGRSIISGRFTIAAQKTFEVQQRVETTAATDGRGTGNAWGNNIYTMIELWREA